MDEHETNLRDLAAMFAMNGLLARESSGAFDFNTHPQDPWRVAQWAYDVADQMMRVRADKECAIPPLPEGWTPPDDGIAAIKPKRKKAE
jgi:hypothetical protein